MDQQQREPTVVPTAGGKPWIVAQTPGLRVVEYVLQAGDALSWHHHSEVTDRFYGLEGLIIVEVRAPTQRIRLHPGATCTVLPGTVHRTVNAATGVSRYLLVQGGGRYDFVTANRSEEGRAA
jgi:quercetin dioxygenase-like cupin family protein